MRVYSGYEDDEYYAPKPQPSVMEIRMITIIDLLKEQNQMLKQILEKENNCAKNTKIVENKYDFDDVMLTDIARINDNIGNIDDDIDKIHNTLATLDARINEFECYAARENCWGYHD